MIVRYSCPAAAVCVCAVKRVHFALCNMQFSELLELALLLGAGLVLCEPKRPWTEIHAPLQGPDWPRSKLLYSERWGQKNPPSPGARAAITFRE